MENQNIIYDKKDGIVTITINRPKVMNALRPKDLVDMNTTLKKAVKDDDVGVIVITGAGRAFCGGVDLKYLRNNKIQGGRVGSVLDDPGKNLIATIESIPKVVVAMVNGYCITGGLEIALACDIIIASKEAKFADTHVRWGLRCSWGMSQRLPHRIGLLKAKELTFTAEMITADEAERIGLINAVAPADRLKKTVDNLTKKIMTNSLPAIAAHKFLYNHSMGTTLRAGFNLEDSTEFVIEDTEERLKRFEKRNRQT
jgi:enoyl-CoA hydratase/carnithine racemase